MIITTGCKRVADVDADFLRRVRTNRDDLDLIDAVCSASELQSHWVSAATNSVEKSLRQGDLREQIFVGLAHHRTEEFLRNHSNDLRLLGPGRRPIPVSAYLLLPDDDLPQIDLSDPNLSRVQNALRYRARSRTRCFSFLASDWTIRAISEFPDSPDPDEARRLQAARADLLQYVGSPLLVLTDQRLWDAFDFAESAASPIKKLELAAHVGLSVDGTEFEMLWRNLRDQGANLARQGRPASKK